MKNMNRIRGCLLGGAIGDALGYAIEFSSESAIFAKYGEKGISEYELSDGKAIISDDTQMTMFTACGIIHGLLSGASDNAERARYIYGCYLDWLKTQSFYEEKDECKSWLGKIDELFERRAPGNTCLSALMSGECGSIESRINHSKGCGGVMRVAPIGLYFGGLLSQDETDLLGAEAAAITHGHELAFVPAAALVHIVSKLAFFECDTVAQAVDSAIDAVNRLFGELDEEGTTVKLLERAKELALSDIPTLDAIHTLGEGWVGEEALAIAVYCALKFEDDFEVAICAAVNHGGDSDSTGAICGNIVGALTGLEGLPRKYLEKLELREEILELSDDLYYTRLLTPEEFLGGDKQREKYKNHAYKG